ncbi:pilus assembly protein TadG-related protein [Frankia sp. AgKG'84/4]|uniref:pilus assembly protein TadG-related protein n=1 Tax=Frankia sp. AgKG'84/4 TaxID=573490 RepID=UPI00200E48C3|nr:pilus assembly protein TadG-related protein [Frankia sp. AgKG'84/4]MCL9793861.1 pilus assembly protein TadG-related protein [Frankia sp. AgKG'84/4]
MGPPARGGCRDDGGYVAVMFAGIVVAIMTSIGLLVDGSIALAAHRQANNEAEQAARAAAQAIDVRGFTSGQALAIDPDAARRAAAAYLAGTGDRYTIEVTGPREITVTVTVTTKTRFLGMVGVGTVTATGTGRSLQVVGTR